MSTNLKSHIFLFVLLLGLQNSCGSKNIADCSSPTAGVPCSPRTKDEDARIALDQGDLETAVKLLKEQITEFPLEYKRYPLLAAALAARSGLDIFNIVKGNFAGSSSLLTLMSSFLPTPASKGAAYATSLADMKDAVAVLNTVPANLRSDVSGDKYASSCALQLMLYQSAYSIMLINQFAYSTSGYDPSQLSKMTAADAALILKNLLAAGAVVPGENGAAANAAVAKAVAAIQAQPGANDQEKIAAYVQASH